VPLKVHQNILERFVVPEYCVSEVHDCPPVVDIDNEPDAALDTAYTIHKSPAVIDPGGVSVDGLAVFVPLSAGTVATPKKVKAIGKC
jgi:hypothetical protein